MIHSLSSYADLNKNCARDASALKPYAFALIGDCSTQHIARAIQGTAFEAGYAFNVFEADYDQLDAQLMDDSSEFYAFKPETALIYMCVEKLYARFLACPVSDRRDFARREAARIREYFGRLQALGVPDVLFFTFAGYDEGVFGAYALKEPLSFEFQRVKLNSMLLDICQETPCARLIDIDALRARAGAEAFNDERMYISAKLTISTRALPLVAKRVVDAVKARDGKIMKCAVLDLDNTLWGGVIGDDGLEGIELGELGAGQAYCAFQSWLKELKERGVMLAVCSKNEEAAARAPFEKHPDMMLRLDDFSAFIANWDDKAANIARIRDMLNIGLDSIVFIDDNPFERDLVTGMLPDVTVPDMPEDPALYVSYLKSLNLFETASYSDEDRARTQLYRAEADRSALNTQYENYDDYLKALDMRATCAPFDAFHIPRIAQLTQRSNQFNLRTVRYTEAQARELMLDDTRIARYYTLSDRFGSHGLISVVVMDRRENELFISEWLMSCRVLKRGMEQFIVNSLARIAAREGYTRLVGEYIPTQKNAMVSDLYARMGFCALGGGLFALDISSYAPQKTYIAEE